MVRRHGVGEALGMLWRFLTSQPDRIERRAGSKAVLYLSRHYTVNHRFCLSLRITIIYMQGRCPGAVGMRNEQCLGTTCYRTAQSSC